MMREESTTPTEMSNSTSDTHTGTTEESKSRERHQINSVCNKSTHDENDSYQNEHVTEIELHRVNGEQYIGKMDKLLVTKFED